jgi:hypothetical protein
VTETGQIPDADTIANRLAIQDVLNKHSRGVDRADGDLLKTAYWPDAEVAYGAYNGPAHPCCESLPQGIKKYAATQHRVANVIIDLHDADAVVESYVTAYHYAAVPDGDDTEMTYIGRYIDHMQRRGSVWKILFRRVVMDWNQNAQATAILEGPPFAGLARGARAPEDPLYAMQKQIIGATK